MLNHIEAEKIVKDCIREVRDFGGGVDSSRNLREVGIQTQDLVKLLRDTIATDQEIGVPSVRDHRIALTVLNLNLSTRVLQVQNMVLFNAMGPEDSAPPIAMMRFRLLK